MADGGDITITWHAQQTELMQALVQQQAGFQKSIDKLNQVGDAGEKAGDKVGSAFSTGITQAGQFVSAMTGVGSAVGGMMAIAASLKQEYQDLLARQKQAANEQLSLAQKQAEAIRNLGDDKTVTGPEALRARIEQMSKDTGISEKVLTGVASGALSARGEMSADMALNTVAAAAKLTPDMDENGLTESAMAAMGLVRRGATPEQALGFLISTQKTSPIKGTENTMKNVAPAINKVSGFGGSTAESGAFVSAMAVGMEDRTGEESATASIRIAEQLAERMPEYKTTAARIAAIRKDPKLRDKLFNPRGGDFKIKDELGRDRSHHFSPLEFRAGSVTAGREMLGFGGNVGSTGKAFDAFLKETPAPAAAEGIFDKEVENQKALHAMRLAALARKSDAATSRTDVANESGAEMSVLTEKMENLMMSSGVGYIERLVNQRSVRMSSNPAEHAADVLDFQARSHRDTAVASAADFSPDERRAYLKAAEEMAGLAKDFREFAKKPLAVTVVAPKGVAAIPGAAGTDRRGK